ncbi:MAG: endonuclease domain-containing protein [Elusimicrobiota bacterium]|nr:endonuclease domain-containing protein [Elusimicrobiota bacterium]
MKKLHYNPNLRNLPSKLRKSGILHEVLLWQQLKGKQINGHVWTRQRIIGSYIVDFYNALNKIAIEVDGYSHNDDKKHENDCKRDEYFKSLKIKVLRIQAKDVLQNIEGVVEFLKANT